MQLFVIWGVGKKQADFNIISTEKHLLNNLW